MFLALCGGGGGGRCAGGGAVAEGGGAVADWVRALAWNGDRTFPSGFEPRFGKNFSLRNFGNSVYPSLPVSFG